METDAHRLLMKISSVLLQEWVAFIGVEDQILSIKAILQPMVPLLSSVRNCERLKQVMCDIEEIIDGSVNESAQKEEIDSTDDKHELLEKLEKLELELSDAYDDLSPPTVFKPFSHSWATNEPYYSDTGDTIVSPVISMFETLSTQEQLGSAVTQQANSLIQDFNQLKRFIKSAERLIISEEGMEWIEQVRALCSSTEDEIGLILYGRVRNKTKWNGPLNLISHVHGSYKLVKQMDQIKVKVRDIMDKSDEVILRRSGERLIPRSARRCSTEELEITCFDDDVDAIMSLLLRDDPRCITISIVGIPGIGKTSLAKLVYDHHAVKDHFPHRSWVSQEDLTLDEMMQQIMGDNDFIRSLLKSCRETGEDCYNILKREVNAFFSEKKHLIVVDGISSDEFWRELGDAFNHTSNGTRILFTARQTYQILQATDTNFTCRLHLRSDAESWALFKHTLKLDNVASKLEEHEEHILRTCGGLPMVIVKLAELLLQTDPTFNGGWSRVLQLLQPAKEPWSEILDEINIGLSLGPGRQEVDGKSPEHISEKCLEELVNKNMVQVTERKRNGKIKTCRLPEAVRTHWLSQAENANFLPGRTDASSGAPRRLAYHLHSRDALFNYIHGNNTPPNSYYKYVISFLCFDTREAGEKPGDAIGNFLDRCISSDCFRCLSVLDLERLYRPKLPKTVGQLIRLKYLGLRHTDLEMLPSFIDKLLSLQTLDLKGTSIKALPTAIWLMRKLRHLFLDESKRATFMPPPKGTGLEDLQTLWGLFIDEQSPVRNGLDALLNLTKLGLLCRLVVPSEKQAMYSQLDAVANWIMNQRQLQSLRLKSFDESGQPWHLPLSSLSNHTDLSSVYLVGKLQNQHLLSQLPQGLIELTLSASELGEDPMQMLQWLPKLRSVRFSSRSYIGKKMLFSSGGFPKLQFLDFWHLELLEELIIEKGSLCNLKDMEIRSCENLKILPDGLQHVKTLQELRLTEVRELSARTKDEQCADWHKIAHVTRVYHDIVKKPKTAYYNAELL